MEKDLGVLEKVDVRSIWLHEANQFTPWLADPKNLSSLGEALKIELELEAQEQRVGPFRADILAKNTADDSLVLIENQMDKTDHKHLGQLLTYAAGLKAATVVWVATEFAEDHKTALEWLNEATNDSLRFFGVQIELWRIDDSRAAARFHVIYQPDEWGKAIQKEAKALAAAGPLEQLRLRYWTAFRTYLLDKKSKLRPQKPASNHWYSFGIGTSLAHLSALLNTKEEKVEVELNITATTAKTVYVALVEKKLEVESFIGAELDWRELPAGKSCRILLPNFVDPWNEEDWPQQFAGLREHLEKFDQAFRPFLANKVFHRREEEI